MSESTNILGENSYSFKLVTSPVLVTSGN